MRAEQEATSNVWLHRWCVFTVGITLLAMTSGMVVTTFKVGMADPIWPTVPWHLLLISWEEPKPGFIVEHTHRALDYLLGLCVIVQAVLFGRLEPRRWVRWLGIAALGCVIVQGLLGGFRVVLHAWVGSDLAAVHGTFAQMVFALLVSLALLTSKSWVTAPEEAVNARMRRCSVHVVGLVFLQLIFGAMLRHTHSPLGPRGHLLTAFAVVGAVVWMFTLDRQNLQARAKPPSLAVTLLAGLVVMQLLLGVEAWMVRYSSGALSELQPVTVRAALVRTAHVLMGSCILATAVVTALQAYRQKEWTVALATTERLEGVAS